MNIFFCYFLLILIYFIFKKFITRYTGANKNFYLKFKKIYFYILVVFGLFLFLYALLLLYIYIRENTPIIAYCDTRDNYDLCRFLCQSRVRVNIFTLYYGGMIPKYYWIQRLGLTYQQQMDFDLTRDNYFTLRAHQSRVHRRLYKVYRKYLRSLDNPER